jgi:hypothetical protein
MAVNFDAPVTLPTWPELRVAYEALQTATSRVLDVHWRVTRIAEQVDESPDTPLISAKPTFAEIGALCVFHADATSRLEEISDYLKDIGEEATNRIASLSEEACDA